MAEEDRWPEPPKTFSMRGALLVAAVLVVSTSLAFLAIYLRRGRTLRTLDFWGMENVYLIQNSDRLFVFRAAERGGKPTEVPDRSELQNVTDIPGISHLREALLADAHYRWEAAAASAPMGQWVVLVFQDGVPERELVVAIELESGWVGPIEATQHSYLTERVREALKRYLAEIENASDRRAD